MINEYLEQNNKKSQEEIDSFFKVDIPKGFRDLNLLLENIQNELNTGWNFKILIKGFASPLASNSYNLKLSKRRINSIINYINLYENGVFKEKIGKQIMLEFLPYGEEVADKKVNDDPKIKKKSIYSINAAKERKIELVGIKVSK
jgi:outer membrane protein OmpA-like peptidoglycan-associated protein